MAKHPHRLLLNEKKTWRCTLPNCRYFIHIGLAHILPGQQSICWECGEEFTLDDAALRDDMPKCAGCRTKASGIDIDAIIADMDEKLALKRAGVKSRDELTPMRRQTMEALGVLPKRIVKEVVEDEPEQDAIESEEAHASDCSSWTGGDCDCM